MKLAGRMDCQGLLVQAILLSLSLLLSRGRARCSNGLLVIYEDTTHAAKAFRTGMERIRLAFVGLRAWLVGPVSGMTD